MSEDRLLPESTNHLRCTVCSHVLDSPVTLPCGHSFCAECIRKRWTRDRRNCSCPECERTFPSPPQLITDTTLAEKVRQQKQKQKQKQKQEQQQKREQQHESGGKSPQKRARRDAASRDALCRKHKRPLGVYCCTDGEIVCEVCAQIEHRGHRIGFVGEERRRKQDELRNTQKTNKQILQNQKRRCGNLKNVLTQIEEEAGQASDYCQSVLVGVIASIQKHYLSMRELIGAQEEAAAYQVSNAVQALEAKIEEMEKRDAELDSLAQSDDDTRFLQEWPALQRLCEEDRVQVQSEPSEVPLLPFESTKRAVKEIAVRLEEFCEKEFASVTDTDSEVERDTEDSEDEKDTEDSEDEKDTEDSEVEKDTEDSEVEKETEDSEVEKDAEDSEVEKDTEDSEVEKDTEDSEVEKETEDREVEQELTGNTEEDGTVQRCGSSNSLYHGINLSQEPTTREEFLQYACDLTLDPTTAHKDLFVSEGDKEVKRRSIGSRNSLPFVRHPERFILRRQLLCREALQAEHCYYEIEVEGDMVEIALVYKRIDRKSRTPRSAFGGNLYSWSLDRSSSYSVSHNNYRDELSTRPQHQKIGVYLKFKEGTVSFYEVSHSMIFLYKTEAKFTEPLYPGFWLGEKCCIRICDLSQNI